MTRKAVHKRDVFRQVGEILGEERATLWWNTENPLFAGITPMQALQLSPHTPSRLQDFINRARKAATP